MADEGHLLVIVRRGATERFGFLEARLVGRPARVIWDRRTRDRRQGKRRVAAERRDGDRRGATSVTWGASGFVIVKRPGASASPRKEPPTPPAPSTLANAAMREVDRPLTVIMERLHELAEWFTIRTPQREWVEQALSAALQIESAIAQRSRTFTGWHVSRDLRHTGKRTMSALEAGTR